MRGKMALGWMGCVCLLVAGASAKESKPAVPGYVLHARTVAILVDPDAGISVDDPTANRVAREDVEAAMLQWGRFETVLGVPQADLVIVLRKGHKHDAEVTMRDPRQNNRAGSVTTTDDGMNIGAQHGSQPGGQSGPGEASGAHPQLEVGRTEDSFEVYQGGVEHPLDASPGWRWVRKDGLHAHDVPAVAEFRKAIAEAEKKKP